MRQIRRNYGRLGGYLVSYLYRPGPWDERWQLHHAAWWPWEPSSEELRDHESR